MTYSHIPVMLREVLAALEPKPGENYLDGTLGGASYSRAIAERIEPGVVIATDLDPMAIANAEKIKKEFKIKNLILVNDNFSHLEKIIQEQYSEKGFSFAGAVFDLGLSSAQLADRSRGFSFQADTPLDMGFGPGQGEGSSTEELVNDLPEEKLIELLKIYGEERFAKRIAGGIVAARKQRRISTTKELVEIIRDSLPGVVLRKPGIHFATKTFQALRIATNSELESLADGLSAAVRLVGKGGRIVVVSYHSLEDRIVKNLFRNLAKGCICPPELPTCQCHQRPLIRIITKKPLLPTEEEVGANPRARSAKLRVAEIL